MVDSSITEVSSTSSASSDFKTDLRLTTINLSGSGNYLQWSCAVVRALKSKGLHHHLSESSPPTTDPSYSTWIKDDNKVSLWLCNSLDERCYNSVMVLETTKEIWDHLRSLYSSEDNLQRLFDIFTAFMTATLGEDIQDFTAHFSGLLDQWNQFQPISADVSVTRKQREALVAALFLSRLPPAYDSVRSLILSDGASPPLTSVFSRVCRVPKNSPPPATDSFSSALATRGRGRGRTGRGASSFRGRAPVSTRGRGSFGRGRGSQFYCDYCGRVGHREETCYAKHGFPDDTPSARHSTSAETSSSSSSASPFTADELAQQ